LGFLKVDNVEDWNVVQMHRAYPACLGSYNSFDVVRRRDSDAGALTLSDKVRSDGRKRTEISSDPMAGHMADAVSAVGVGSTANG
jgi:hypothetical protein